MKVSLIVINLGFCDLKIKKNGSVPYVTTVREMGLLLGGCTTDLQQVRGKAIYDFKQLSFPKKILQEDILILLQ